MKLFVRQVFRSVEVSHLALTLGMLMISNPASADNREACLVRTAAGKVYLGYDDDRTDAKTGATYNCWYTESDGRICDQGFSTCKRNLGPGTTRHRCQVRELPSTSSDAYFQDDAREEATWKCVFQERSFENLRKCKEDVTCEARNGSTR